MLKKIVESLRRLVTTPPKPKPKPKPPVNHRKSKK